MKHNSQGKRSLEKYRKYDISSNKRLPLIGIPCQTILSTGAGELSIFSVYQNMASAIAKAGGIAIMIPPYEGDKLKEIYYYLDGLLLDGGADINPQCYSEEIKLKTGPIDSKRDKLELLLTKWGMEDNIPIFGICRGMQMINVAAGGTLLQDISTECPGANRHAYHPEKPSTYLAHSISIKPGSIIHKHLDCTEAWVNSMHHQAIKTVAPGFTCTGFSKDGIIEGIEADNFNFLLGVQWHPEEMINTDVRMLSLFTAFIEACQASAGLLT